MKKVILVLGLVMLAMPAWGQGFVADDKPDGPYMNGVEKAHARQQAALAEAEAPLFKPLGAVSDPNGPTVYKLKGELLDGNGNVDLEKLPSNKAGEKIINVGIAKELGNAVKVTIVGEIIKHISAEMYEFKDETGMIVVRINEENWKDVYWDEYHTYPTDRVSINGWTETGYEDGVRIKVDEVWGVE